ncbi:MAG: heavy metal-binding domain-containing protein [Kordiimonadaceae bacterium]|nr:heavy metal-binding domain-containing protein [Kordiimonadaceae bacterium]
MDSGIDLWFNFGLTLCLLLLGFIFGTIAERRHFQSIAKREKELSYIKIYTHKNIPEYARAVNEPLVSGFVVLSTDYLKSFLSSVRKLFGGRIRSYESLVKRSKREAVLRLKEKARTQGAKAVYNVRIDTTSVSKGRNRAVVTVEAFAYGTAVK